MSVTRTFLTFAVLIISTAAQAQSFPCSLARKPDEIAICRSRELSALDFKAATWFAARKLYVTDEYKARFIAEQRAWLQTRGLCGGSYDCIKNLYKDRLSYFTNQNFPRRSDAELEAALPHGIGQCVETTIAVISDRAGHDIRIPLKDRMGTEVYYSNGGAQFSYVEEAPVDRSRVGDRVRMCLVSVPKNCPQGDNRGKVYKTWNLRTGEVWSLSDALHMCGGA